MSEPVERALPLPYAFDVTIGYWTGEPDWELLVQALAGAADPDLGDTSAAIFAWIGALRAGEAAALLRVGNAAVSLTGAELVVSGPSTAVEALVGRLAAELSV